MKSHAPMTEPAELGWTAEPLATDRIAICQPTKEPARMNDSTLRDTLAIDDDAQTALRKAAHNARNARENLARVVLMAIAENDLPAEVLRIDVNKLRRILYSPRR
jgi:hypothetical protein